MLLWSSYQEWRGHWTVNYTSTKFYNMLSYLLTSSTNYVITQKFLSCLSSLGMYINISSIVLSLNIPEYISTAHICVLTRESLKNLSLTKFPKKNKNLNTLRTNFPRYNIWWRFSLGFLRDKTINDKFIHDPNNIRYPKG